MRVCALPEHPHDHEAREPHLSVHTMELHVVNWQNVTTRYTMPLAGSPSAL